MKEPSQKSGSAFREAMALVALLAAAGLLYFGISWMEQRSKKPETRTELLRADQETVELDGVTYCKRDDLTVILAMGVDHETQDEYEYRKAGQADFLRLIVLDNKKKTVQQLQIDRDTITPVTMLGVLGDRYEPVT